MQIREETQQNPVAGEVSALVAVVRPILEGTLYALKHEVVTELGGYHAVKLSMLARVYRQGDGDCGICFEWAVHDAISRNDPAILERVDSALKRCNVPGALRASILFGAEKSGAAQIIQTASETLTDESRLLSGARGQPVKLKRHLTLVAAAFRRPRARLALPYSISGLWKADLFLGATDSDRWVGTSVKLNAREIEPGRGLRIGIVPTTQGRSDSVRKDGDLVVCPLPYDASFMEIFYRGWTVVQTFIAAGGKMPAEVALPAPADRYVAKMLVERRNYPVLDVVEALAPLSQPQLLQPLQFAADTHQTRAGHLSTGAVVTPVSSRI